MHNDLRSLYICYPFMTVEQVPDWFKYVKNIRIVFTLPAMQAASMDSNRENIKVVLTAISPTTATVKISCASYFINDKEINLPVTTNRIPCTNSFVYVTSAMPTLTGLSYAIHPACLVFMQAAPVLYMESASRGGSPFVRVTANQTDSGITTNQQVYQTADRKVSDVLRLMNGYNLEITGSSDSVLFTCGVGLGNGTYQEAPYVKDAETFKALQGKRVRSINGLTGNVLIAGDRSVEVEGSTAQPWVLDIQARATE